MHLVGRSQCLVDVPCAMCLVSKRSWGAHHPWLSKVLYGQLDARQLGIGLRVCHELGRVMLDGSTGGSFDLGLAPSCAYNALGST
jgi:hypothetical protein